MSTADTRQSPAAWLLGAVDRKAPTVSPQLRHDPKAFLRTDTSAQGALCRQMCETEPLPSDGTAVDALAAELAAHIEKKREPANEAFQKGYAELVLKQSPALQDATVRLIDEEWENRRKIGHYELFSALILEYPEEEPVRKTLAEIHNNLKTWNNKGWCPWTPALWMRILWLGRHLSNASADITAQLEYIDAHLSEGGTFQYREPFCLMYCTGLMGHPVMDRMLDRFLSVIVDGQQADGGWGEFSYIAFTLLRKWDLMDTLAP